KTWHEGTSDRDLLVLQGSYQPREGYFAYATAWVDSYGSDDTAKADGMELTRFIASGGHRGITGNGWTMTLSSFQFPELLSTPPSEVDPLQVTDGELRRADLSFYRNLSARTRGSVRTTYWTDGNESGAGGDLRWDIRSWPSESCRAGASLFVNQGRYSDVQGLRIDGSWSADIGSVNLMWESSQHSLHGVSGDLEQLLQHRARIGWDLWMQDGWSLSVYLEQQMGDELSANSIGLYVQRSF
ncbi:MAG: hypothetical protein AAB263_11835, partial [Planctomycetota bacterium]